jgi:hypothetical protein
VISNGDSPGEEKKPLKLPNTYKFYPLTINMTAKIAELMKSNEARDYMKGITEHSVKLKQFLNRNCKEEAAYLSGEIDLDHESTRFRHKVLHQALDELFACYITEHPDQHGFFKMEFGDFLEWSANMTLEATCEQQD